MAYYTDLFSPETYQRFSISDRTISGFRVSQKKTAQRLQPGDKMICYLTKVSRWVGVLRVLEGPFESSDPIFAEENDPFVVRFRVEPEVLLEPEYGIPVHHDPLWNNLSFTKDVAQGSAVWTGAVRRSLNKLDDADGHLLEHALLDQNEKRVPFPFTEQEKRMLTRLSVRLASRELDVDVPDKESDELETQDDLAGEPRESIRLQALLASIGAKMGYSIWVPRSDRARVLQLWDDSDRQLLEKLPLNYDETTLQTIENIDLLWIRGRAIVRAFEVEHSTAVYSGILRMADLVALQPNMSIRLHIVAPDARRDKVFRELRRPVFAALEEGRLREICTFVPYDAVEELAALPHLKHLSETVVDDYGEDSDV